MPEHRPMTAEEIDAIEGRLEARARRERQERERRELRRAWRTTGWGAVGVDWCAHCGSHFDGPAYIYDDWFAGRTYTCRRCIDIITRHSTTPQPCEQCGRPFVWVGGTLNKPGVPPRPRPRRHLCSDACRRADRAKRRRTSHDTRRCAACDTPFRPTRADAQYCTAACRQEAYRARSGGSRA